MHDLVVATRCPRCLAPLLEYVHHAHAMTDPPTVRRECCRCSWTETTEPITTR